MEHSIEKIFFISMAFGFSVALFVWLITNRPCNCYKMVALGGMGALLGTVKGIFLVLLLEGANATPYESIMPVLFLSGLFAALLQFRYAVE